MKIATFFIWSVATLLLLLIHLYIGGNAIKYGRGVSKKRFFFFISFLYFLVLLTSIPQYFIMDQTDQMIADTSLAAILVDMLLCWSLFDLIYSAIRVKKIEKENI